jgi:hypothetical protein
MSMCRMTRFVSAEYMPASRFTAPVVAAVAAIEADMMRGRDTDLSVSIAAPLAPRKHMISENSQSSRG